MFFSGTLQEGILKAVQERKRVICFVRSDNDESTKWAQDYLQPLSEIMHDHAVVLELRHGSTEAGYLAAICPVETAPMVVIIHNGQVKGALKPPMSVEEFRKQILTTMDLRFSMSGSAPSRPAETAGQYGGLPLASSESDSRASRPAVVDDSAELRRRKLESERTGKGKEVIPEAGPQSDPDSNANQAYQAKLAEEKKKQRQSAAEEKKRVLDLIEADKQERRKQAAARAAERNAQRENDEQNPETEASLPNTRSKAGAPSDKSRLQFRLWDGRTERADFTAGQTLADVREWLDRHVEPRAGPYSLREVIGVGAARQLDVANEQETLSSLGLTPSATLVVKPIVNVASRFSEPSTKNTLIKIFIGPFLIIRAFILAIWFALSGLFQGDPRPGAQVDRERPQVNESSVQVSNATGPRAKIQTLDDQNKDRDKPTLYNGNQLGVLPNADHDDDEAK